MLCRETGAKHHLMLAALQVPQGSFRCKYTCMNMRRLGASLAAVCGCSSNCWMPQAAFACHCLLSMVHSAACQMLMPTANRHLCLLFNTSPTRQNESKMGCKDGVDRPAPEPAATSANKCLCLLFSTLPRPLAAALPMSTLGPSGPKELPVPRVIIAAVACTITNCILANDSVHLLQSTAW